MGGAIALACLLYFTLSPTSTPVSKATPAQGEAAWKLLQQNAPGYVVMMRHADAPGVGDPASFRLGDCSTQRNLGEGGRAQARRIGDAFRVRQVPVASVFSSQWCRCLETARLLNLGKVKPFPALNSFFADDRTEPQQTAAVRQLILQHRNQPGVLVLVSHQVNITALTGVVPRSGESVVLRAGANRTVQLVGRLEPQ